MQTGGGAVPPQAYGDAFAIALLPTDWQLEPSNVLLTQQQPTPSGPANEILPARVDVFAIPDVPNAHGIHVRPQPSMGRVCTINSNVNSSILFYFLDTHSHPRFQVRHPAGFTGVVLLSLHGLPTVLPALQYSVVPRPLVVVPTGWALQQGACGL